MTGLRNSATTSRIMPIDSASRRFGCSISAPVETGRSATMVKEYPSRAGDRPFLAERFPQICLAPPNATSGVNWRRSADFVQRIPLSDRLCARFLDERGGICRLQTRRRITQPLADLHASIND